MISNLISDPVFIISIFFLVKSIYGLGYQRGQESVNITHPIELNK